MFYRLIPELVRLIALLFYLQYVQSVWKAKSKYTKILFKNKRQ